MENYGTSRWHRFLAFLLAFMMVFGTLNLGAIAAFDDGSEEPAAEAEVVAA